MNEKIIKYSIKAFAILLIAFVAFQVIAWFGKGEERIITSSTLKEVVDISELSAAQFTYNGIAEVYNNNTSKSVKCRIRYHAKVKAGIDMENIDFDVNEKDLIVKPLLPKIEITSNIADEESLSFIPDGVDIELQEALEACEKDALMEAEKSGRLFETAEDNLKSIIEALLLPVIEPKGYKIIWD